MVTRPAVFIQVGWRSLVSCIVGGAALGAVLGTFFFLFDLVTSASDKTQITDIALITYIGGVFGILLGLVAGVVLGVLGALLLVPYPGAQKTKRVIRVGGMALVGLFTLLFLIDATFDAGALVFFAVLIIGGQVGAFLLANWIVGWYIRRSEPAAGEAGPSPTD